MSTCHKYNSEYGGLERELLTHLAVCVDPNIAASDTAALILWQSDKLLATPLLALILKKII